MMNFISISNLAIKILHFLSFAASQETQTFTYRHCYVLHHFAFPMRNQHHLPHSKPPTMWAFQMRKGVTYLLTHYLVSPYFRAIVIQLFNYVITNYALK